jgi:trigger factor
MQITEEKIDAQNARLKIKLEPGDYANQYDDALKSYRKQITMPGFRPGKVPMGVVKKKYGRSLLAEEINKVLNNSIQKYISDKELKVLGSPLPTESDQEVGDWDNPSEFEFVYELGLAPELKVNISNKDKFTYHLIDVDKKLLDTHIKDIARRYGKLSDVEKAEATDMLIGDFVELDAEGEVVVGGIMNSSTITLETLDKDTQKKFVGAKVGDEIVVDPHKVSSNHDDLGRMLNITHEEVHDINTDFKFMVKEVKRMEPAEINTEFFDKLFGEGNVKTEEEFRTMLTEELEKGFLQDSDRLFKRDITNKLIADYNPSLPDEFLKRWIQMSNEKPITPEEVERDYSEYQKGLQWQLIFNDLISQEHIKVTQEEVVDLAKDLMAGQFAQYGIPAPEDAELTQSAMRVLSNEDEARKIYDMLYDKKLLEYIRTAATVNEKKVSYDAFVELASKA